MSILVKGMKMPKDCDSCWLSRMRGSSLGGILDCKILGTIGAAMDDPHDILNNRHPDCPLIELPEVHGRLIDANAFSDFITDAIKRQEYENLKIDDLLTVADVLEAVVSDLTGTGLDRFNNAPTIIEAEGDEE